MGQTTKKMIAIVDDDQSVREGMSGLELLDRLLASGKSIPTIVVTAFTQEADARPVRSNSKPRSEC